MTNENSKSLFQLHPKYDKYPRSIYRGYFGKYPLENDLSERDIIRRKEWLDLVVKLSRTDFHKKIINTFYEPSDKEFFMYYLKKHGVFSRRFFYTTKRLEVVKKYHQSALDDEDIVYFYLKSYEIDDYQKNPTKKIYQRYKTGKEDSSLIISFITDYLYDYLILKAISSEKINRYLIKWYKIYKKKRRCEICGKQFSVIDIRDWLYFGLNGYKNFCIECLIIQEPSEDELQQIIPEFVNRCGFIPSSNAHILDYSFTSRINPNNMAEVIISYGKMGGIGHVKKIFGSWFKAMSITNSLPDGVQVTARGIRCLANDGHVCNSMDEQFIDNWLNEKGISHEKEPCYPKHELYNKSGKRRADWKVGDVYIEYFGLIGDEKYEKKMDEKILLASSLNLKLIDLYPSDLNNLDKSLNRINM